ncbi:MAG: hypothetical protein K0U98_10485 [Deltaproteobacteria bacterium]|nr:hypothetical protein [Deltaproteobacteria bacterium]
MNSRLIITLSLLLAIVAVPAIADSPTTLDTTRDLQSRHSSADAVKSANNHSDGSLSRSVLTNQTITPQGKIDELTSLGIVQVNLIEAAITPQSIAPCEALEGTACSASNPCPKCIPVHGDCPLTPCYCLNGGCHCDIEAPDL